MGHKDVPSGPNAHGPATTHRSGIPATDAAHEPESHVTGSPAEAAEGNCDTLWIDLGGEG